MRRKSSKLQTDGGDRPPISLQTILLEASYPKGTARERQNLRRGFGVKGRQAASGSVEEEVEAARDFAGLLDNESFFSKSPGCMGAGTTM